MQNHLRLEIEKQSILKHPFYRLWSEGKLTHDALKTYAKQYYHFVDEFPHFLETMLANCDNPSIRSGISENLTEERKHPSLWLTFAGALGLSREEVVSAELLPETVESVQTFRSLMAGSTPSAAASVLTYEAQVPEVARQKMEGLLKFYGIETPEALEYFRVHMLVDLDHVKVWEQILSEIPVESSVLDAAKKSLGAQWRLLDGVLRVSQLDMNCGEQTQN